MTDNSRPGNPQVCVRMPPELGNPIRARAKKTNRTIAAVILEIVADSLGVKSNPPRRGRQAKEQTK